MQYTQAIREPDVYCYTLAYWMTYDPEDIWSLVQRHGGSVAPLAGGYYDYYIDKQYACILVLAYPLLRRQYQKDLYT
jgi:hypothetical protein